MILEIEKIKVICEEKISANNLGDDYKSRLAQEILDLEKFEANGEHKADDLLKLMERNKPAKTNRSHSVVLFLLGISEIDPIANNLAVINGVIRSGDCPDIDTDFKPDIRDWVKEHVKEVFGEKHVCSIGTYQTFKTKAVIVDVARVLGVDVHESMEVTKPLEAVFDEDEEDKLQLDSMSFDELCEHFKELRDYFAKYPEVRRHAEILRNQVRNMGTHAGGVIISDLDLTDRIPLLYDKPGAEDRKIVSAWAESGSAQELSSVGLVKFDLLGLNNLPILEETAHWIEETTGVRIEKNQIPVDDVKVITKSAKKDLTGIFQFESGVTRKVADAVGINGLDDIAVVTSLIRPGPMGAEINGIKMPFEYARRKHGGEYDAPPFMKSALANTYGLLPFQEDIMRISKVLAGFSGSEANKLRKACSKKKKDLMEEMKKKFIKGAQKRVEAGEITEEEVENVFSQIETFAGYGFNKCLALDTEVETPTGTKKISDLEIGDLVKCPDGEFQYVTDVIPQGKQTCFKVTLEDGRHIVCTSNHKFLCADGGIRTLEEMVGIQHKSNIACSMGGSWIVECRCVGQKETMDITVDSKDHLFMANGIPTSNSHAVTYGMVTAAELWFKEKYPVQFFTALLNNTALSAKKMGNDNVFSRYLDHVRGLGIAIKAADVNISKEDFATDGKSIYFGLGHIKGVGASGADIVKHQPYASLEEFVQKTNVNLRVLKGLLYAGAFNCWGDKNEMSEQIAILCANRTPNSSTQLSEDELRSKVKATMEEVVKARDSGDMAKMQSLVAELSKYNKALETSQKKKSAPRKKPTEVETHNDDEWDELEAEYTGLVLSRPPIYLQWKDQIMHNDWYMPSTIHEAKKKIVRVFGKLTDLREKTSKNGNQMHIAYITDGMAKMTFFVFSNTWEHFRQNFAVGDVGVFPLSKFDDGDTRFFTDRAVCTLLQRT